MRYVCNDASYFSGARRKTKSNPYVELWHLAQKSALAGRVVNEGRVAQARFGRLQFPAAFFHRFAAGGALLTHFFGVGQ